MHIADWEHLLCLNLTGAYEKAPVNWRQEFSTKFVLGAAVLFFPTFRKILNGNPCLHLERAEREKRYEEKSSKSPIRLYCSETGKP